MTPSKTPKKALKPPSGRPAKPYEPGNDIALKHGAYSPAEQAKRAAAVHEALLDHAPWIAETHYAPSVDRYLKATAREQLAHDALIGMKPTAKGYSRLLEVATAAARLSWKMADELGLTPKGHATLKILVAGGEHAEASLADLAAEGRRIGEQRAQADIDGTATEENDD